jgi:UDP-N-acetyl-D-galactosamine dehydrogenase
MDLKNRIIAVIGLGYVGLPLAVAFGKQRPVLGFDIQEKRIDELRSGFDRTQELSRKELDDAQHLTLTSDPESLKKAQIFIVTVPTPIDINNQPDISLLLTASKLIGAYLKRNDVVIYESTVYPGCTEEDCLPVLEKASGLKLNNEFYLGYSPERINPGDKSRRIDNIVKVTSGSTQEVAFAIDSLYQQIVTAGTHLAPSIKVAEAAKVIENTQRDLNIGLINELAIIFNRMKIDTEAVLDAAGSKWNFLPFRPGLVGGHCIGVDPYYLTYKAEAMGYSPEIILAGRRVNNRMGNFVASQIIKSMTSKGIVIQGAMVLIMGLTFKENCPDIRNTKVVDVISELKEYGCVVEVYDPWVDSKEAHQECGVAMVTQLKDGSYDAIILAVAHDHFKSMTEMELRSFCKDRHILYDLKYILPSTQSDLRL